MQQPVIRNPRADITPKLLFEINPAMGELQVRKDQPVLTKEAQKTRPDFPTYQEFMQSNEPKLGETEIPSAIREAARAGDESAQIKLDRAYEREYHKFNISDQIPVGTKLTTMTDEGIPLGGMTLQFDQAFLNTLPEKQRKRIEKLLENRIQFTPEVQKLFPDPYVQAALLDRISSGDYFDETSRAFGEEVFKGVPEFLQLLIDTGQNLKQFTMMGATQLGGYTGLMTPEEVSRDMEHRKAMIEENYRTADGLIGRFSSYGDFARILDADLKEYMRETYGEDFMKKYQLPGPSGMVSKPLVNAQQAKALMDYGYKQLPALDQFASFLTRNVGMTSVTSVPYYGLGAIRKKRLNKWLEKNPEYRNIDPVEAFRIMRTRETNSAFLTGYYDTIHNIARKMPFTGKAGYRGSLGTVMDTQRSRQRLNSLKSNIDQKRLEIENATDSDVRKQLAADLDSLESEYSRTFIRGGFIGQPAIVAQGVDEAVIAAGQTAGYQYGEAMGLSSDTGGLIGALSAAVLGKPGIKYTLKTAMFIPDAITGFHLGAVLDGVAREGEDFLRVASNGRIPVGIITNRRFDAIRMEYESQGITFDAKARKEYEAVADFMAGIPDEYREDVFKSVVEISSVRNQLIKGFDEKDQAQAADLMRLPFAAISELSILQAIERNSIGNIKSMGDIGNAVQAQVRQEKLLLAQQNNLNQLRTILARKGADTQDYERALNWVQTAEKSTNQQLMEIAARREDSRALLNNYKQSILRDPASELTSETFDQLVKIESDLNMSGDIVLGIEEQRAIVNKSFSDVADALVARMEALSPNIADPKVQLNYGRHLEIAYDLKLKHRIALMKAGYAKADKMMEGKEVDISDFVMEIAGDLQAVSNNTRFKGLFSAQNKFFTGTSGRSLLMTMENMAKRELTANFEPEEITQFVAGARSRTLDTGEDNDFFIAEDATFLQIAAALSANDITKGFNPFRAMASEVDEVRGHLTREANRLDGVNDTLASQYAKRADTLENSLNDIEGLVPELKAARDNAKDVRFDPYRKGGMAQVMDSGRLSEPVSKDTLTGFQYLWKTGKEPTSWHRPMAESINKSLFSTEDISDNLTDLANEAGQFVRTWGDTFVDARGEKVVGFDLTTETGLENFQLAKQSVDVLIRNAWARERTRQLNLSSDRIRERARQAGVSPKELGVPESFQFGTGEYNFNILDNINKIEDALTVQVKQGDDIIDVKLFDFHDITAQETDIIRMVSLDPNLKSQLDELTIRLNDGINKLDSLDTVLANQQAKSLDKLKVVADMDIRGMFDKISTEGIAGVMDLRARFMKDGGMSGEDFDNAMKFMIPKMLMERAGLGVEPKRTLRKLGTDGQEYTVETFINPEVLINDLTKNKAVMSVVDEFMDKESKMFLINAARFAQISQGQNALVGATFGGLRPISHNEIVSRAFNLSRQMVSPQYVAAEFAFRLMSQRNLSMMQLVAESRDAGAILNKLLISPREFEDKDVKALLPLLESFIIREYARMGETVPEFVNVFPPEEDNQDENVQ